jgi:signal transduction histidine kinase
VRALSQHVRLERDFAKDLPTITIDDNQIKQVLLNLAINALQVMPEGGRLALRTARQGERVIVEVEDEGGGVDPAISARIFDPFFTTKEKGVGLGLSIAYKIAAQHGGSLTVRNENRGAVFQLKLPS